MTTAHPPESRSADSTAVSDEGQAPPLVHEMAPGQRFPSPNQVDMERGPFWRAGLLPESPWEAHPVTIIANLGEPIGESRIRHQNQLAVNHQRHPGHPRHRHRRVHPPPRHGILTRSAVAAMFTDELHAFFRIAAHQVLDPSRRRYFAVGVDPDLEQGPGRVRHGGGFELRRRHFAKPLEAADIDFRIGLEFGFEQLFEVGVVAGVNGRAP